MGRERESAHAGSSPAATCRIADANPVFGNVGFGHMRIAHWAGLEVNQPFKCPLHSSGERQKLAVLRHLRRLLQPTALAASRTKLNH